MRLGLLKLRLRRLQRGIAPVQLGAADEVLRQQILVACQVSRSQVAVGLRGGGLRTGGVCGQFVVLRVQPGQHLPGLDRLAQLSLALNHFAAHPKSQP